MDIIPMSAEKANSLFTEALLLLKAFSDSEDSDGSLLPESVISAVFPQETVTPPHDCTVTCGSESILDRALEKLYGRLHGVPADVCTICHKGVFMQLWYVHGQTVAGARYGYFVPDGSFLIAECSPQIPRIQ